MKDIQPYEPLRDNVDTALQELHAKMLVLQQGINQDAPPIVSASDAHDVNKAIAVLEAGINAFTSEYQHMTELNKEMRDQRDELKRKLESLKRMFNQSDDTDDPNTTTGRKKRRK